MSEQKKKKKSATERPARDLAAEAQQILDAFGAGVREDRDYPALHLAPPVGRLNDPNGLVTPSTSTRPCTRSVWFTGATPSVRT